MSLITYYETIQNSVITLRNSSEYIIRAATRKAEFRKSSLPTAKRNPSVDIDNDMSFYHYHPKVYLYRPVDISLSLIRHNYIDREIY